MIGRIVRLVLLALLAYPVLVLGLGLLYLKVPPVSTLMLGRWVTGRQAERSYVPLAAVAPVLPAAVISSEDARFCQHRGVDWQALSDVMEDAEDGAPSRGASTVAMQVAKNLFLWPSRSYIRKAMEIPLALYLDFIWPKRRMIEVYLNIAEWGEGTFGAEAAARRYFNKSARDLSRREASLLAASLPNPLRRDPAHPTRWLGGHAGTIAARSATTPLDCIR